MSVAEGVSEASRFYLLCDILAQRSRPNAGSLYFTFLFAVRSKRTSERCERTSEQTSEWPSTYVSILACSRPQCNVSCIWDRLLLKKKSSCPRFFLVCGLPMGESQGQIKRPALSQLQNDLFKNDFLVYYLERIYIIWKEFIYLFCKKTLFLSFGKPHTIPDSLFYKFFFPRRFPGANKMRNTINDLPTDMA